MKKALALTVLLAAPAAGQTVTQLAIVGDGKPVTRTEIYGKLPKNSDFFAQYSKVQGDDGFLKGHFQTFPWQTKHFEGGFILEYVHHAQTEGGIVARLKRPEAQIDMRYFPATRRSEVFGYASGEKWNIDMLSGFSYQGDKGFVRIGIDRKVGRGFSVGVEGNFSLPHREKNYLGVRAKKTFNLRKGQNR
ncbi:MAG: hypothetical protein OXR66_00045 [Candidatus Woesearchaeota archaeon]|nr:hypothetical protein [Candidatus Woesearchaeota archaeon]